MMKRNWKKISLLAVWPALLAASTAQAANITVDAGGNCTLADAITAANTDTAAGGCEAGSGDDTITLQTDVTLAETLPEIASTITIEGGGHFISGDNNAGVGSVLRVGRSTGNLTLKETTVKEGNSSDGGGGILNLATLTMINSTVSDNASTYVGGGIYNDGQLTLENSTVSGNTSLGWGGGIGYDDGTITLINSTVSNNTAPNCGGIATGNPTTLTNSTVSGNTATAGDGGGICSYNNLTLTDSTVSDNTASGNGGGIYNWGTLTLVSTIVSGNTADSAGNEVYLDSGTATADSFNILGHSGETSDEAFSNFMPGSNDVNATSDSDTSTELTAIIDTNLADNGGHTQTHALVTGSPAINLDASCSAGQATDQRGYPRPTAGCDAGAFEFILNHSAWEQVGEPGFSAGQIGAPSIDIDGSGSPYVFYMDYANGQKASAMDFNGTDWEQVGAAGFSVGQISASSIAINSSGIPYVAYIDKANGSKASVMRFNGTDWEQVGAAGFSASQIYHPDLAIDSNSRPYIAYQDYARGWKTSVMRFNGTDWEQVGAAGFSAGQANYTSLALDSSDRPYVAYQDVSNSNKASVMRFNGTAWEQVGTAGFSAGQANYTSLALDSSDKPYVAYRDVSNGSKASVMRFNGTDWEQIGEAGFSAGAASFTILALDSSGRPYVAYQDVSNSNKASVMRFNGTAWEQVGTAGFSAGSAVYTRLALDSSGRPYVAYRDDANGSKASVMRFNQGPIASAGINQTVVQGKTVCFDGSGSFDANDDPLAYVWSITDKPVGSSAVLDNPSGEKTCLTTDVIGTYQVSLVINDGTIDSPVSTAEAVAIPYLTAITQILQDAGTAIDAIAPAVLKNANQQNALTNQINAALTLVDQGYYGEAFVQLNSTLGKTDGCAEAGAPDKNDWIQDCASQEQVYPLIAEALGYLESILSEITERYIFVTSAQHNGKFGGLSGADAFCQQLAQNASLPGGYKAWLSDNTGSPATRMFRSDVPYILPNGTQLAQSWRDLTDGTLLAPIAVNESGNSLSYVRTWTNTTASGTQDNSSYSCANWSSALRSDRGLIGYGEFTSSYWTKRSIGNPCDMQHRLYCVQQ